MLYLKLTKIFFEISLNILIQSSQKIKTFIDLDNKILSIV